MQVFKVAFSFVATYFAVCAAVAICSLFVAAVLCVAGSGSREILAWSIDSLVDLAVNGSAAVAIFSSVKWMN